MKWFILVLWAIITIVNLLKGGISTTEVYIGASVILAAEYIAEEVRNDK